MTFCILDLVRLLIELLQRDEGAWLMRNQVGNLVVLNERGEYVGWIDLSDPVQLHFNDEGVEEQTRPHHAALVLGQRVVSPLEENIYIVEITDDRV